MMAICPVANSVGCNECGVVNFCFLKTVLGNYGDDHMDAGGEVKAGAVTEEQSEQNSEVPKTTDSETNPPN